MKGLMVVNVRNIFIIRIMKKCNILILWLCALLHGLSIYSQIPYWSNNNNVSFHQHDNMDLDQTGQFIGSVKYEDVLLYAMGANSGGINPNLSFDRTSYDRFTIQSKVFIGPDYKVFINYESEDSSRVYAMINGRPSANQVGELKHQNNVKRIQNYLLNSYNNTIDRYDINWQKKSISFSDEHILDYFIYDSLHNYVLTKSNVNSHYVLHRFDYNHLDHQVLATLNLGFDLKEGNFIVQSDGSLLCANDSNQLLIVKDTLIRESNFNSILVNEKLERIIVCLDATLMILTDRSFYHSSDQGASWHRLNKLDLFRPKNIIKFMAIDSNYAIAVNKENLGNEFFHFFIPGILSWNSGGYRYDHISFTELIYAGEYKFFGLDTIHGFGTWLQFEENNKFSRRPFTYKSNPVLQMFKHQQRMYGINYTNEPVSRVPIYTDDSGNVWSELETIPYRSDSMAVLKNMFGANDKVIAEFVIKNKATNKDDSVEIFYTTDKAKSWIQAGNRSKIVNQKLGKKVIGMDDRFYYLGNDIYSSSDFGLTIERDPRLSEFYSIYDMVFNPDSSVFVVAKFDTISDYQLYKTKDFENYMVIDAPFNHGLIHHQSINNDRYPIVVLSNDDHGVWISEDGGSQWKSYNEGLRFYPSYNDILGKVEWGSWDRLYMPICFNGYKYMDFPIVNNQNNVTNTNLQFCPNPCHDAIQICDYKEDYTNYTISFYNAQLQDLGTRKITSSDIALDDAIADFHGILFYKIHDAKRRIINTGTLLKH